MERFQYAQSRINQKKRLWYHLIVFVLGSACLYVVNNWMDVGTLRFGLWYKWVILVWAFVFLMHLVQVFITNRFMNAKWEEEQLQKLMAKQEARLRELEKKVTDLHQQ